MADTNTIKCGECGHSNEPERVYCHNCGAKLDRSLLPKPAETKETAEQAKTRYNRMVNPRSSVIGKQILTLIKVLLGAAILASLGLMCMPPEDAPEKNDEPGTFNVLNNWVAQTTAPGATAVSYSETEVNAYLKTLKSDDSFVKFKAAYAKLSPGIVTIWVKREMWGLPLWSSLIFHPVVKDGKVSSEPVSIHYGRLGVAPSMTFAHGWGVGPVFSALGTKFKDLDRLQDITVGDGKITVTTKAR